MSVGLTVAAFTRMRTSPRPGSGSRRFETSRTSGPPYRENVTARMPSLRLSVFAAELAVVPAHDLLGDDLEHHALGRAGPRPGVDRRRVRLRFRPRLERGPHGALVLEDLAAPA